MVYSVNQCTRCKRRQLSVKEVEAGYRICPDCLYFENMGIYSIEDYNEWLKKNKGGNS
jgi:hypothetical protein